MAQFNIRVIAIIALLIAAQAVTAKRGCMAFGHSCLGGHGKRSSNDFVTDPEMMTQAQTGQEETPPHPGYPRSGFNSILPPGDDIIPIRDGGAYDHEDAVLKDIMKYRLRNIVKHWMDSYRRNQSNNDNGYLVEGL